MFELKKLSAFDNSVQVLWEIDLKIEANEIVALLGDNSSGKTALLSAIMGLVPVYSGGVYYNNIPVDGLPRHEYSEHGIAYFPTGGRFFADMSVQENIEIAMYPIHLWNKRKERLIEIYEMFPLLSTLKKRYARELDAAERQLLTMARAMASSAKLCLFDEISYGLTPVATEEILSIVWELRREGGAVLLAEQYANKTLEIADRAYVLKNGRIVYDGSCAELLESDYVHRSYLGL